MGRFTRPTAEKLAVASRMPFPVTWGRPFLAFAAPQVGR